MKNIKGVIFCAFFALISYFICCCEFCRSINLNSLTFAIIVGMIVGNVFHKFLPETFKDGISFSAKRLLRLAIYIGSTVHEVAQVVAAGSAVSPQVCDTSVIVKLTRVMMLVPYLFLLGFYLSKKSHTKRTKVPMPWFAILFVVMCGFNSLNILPAVVKSGIIEFDVFLLTVAMFGLGVETNFEKIKGLGMKPILLAGIMFVWLVVAGAVTAKLIV